MPLSHGQKVALFVLLSKNSDSHDGKSDLRNGVEADMATGKTAIDSLKARAAVLDPHMDTSAMTKDFFLDDPSSIRDTLELPYTGGSCPDGGTTRSIFTLLKTLP